MHLVLAAATAAQLLARVDAHYQKTSSFSAGFVQEYVNTVVGKTTKSKGTVDVQRPSMRWDYTAPTKIHFISDGTTLWEVDEGLKQVIVTSIANVLLPASVSFITGKGSLAKSFTASLDTVCTTKGAACVKLVPSAASAQVAAIWLGVDPTSFEVEESIVLEVGGNTNHFWFTKRTLKTPATFGVDLKALAKKGYTVVQPKP